MINHENLTVEIETFFLSLLWGNHYGSFFGIGLPAIGRIWFLPALFLSKLIYRIMLGKFDEKSRFPLLLILSFVCMFLGSHNVILPQNIDMIFVCVLFMDIGHKLKEIDLSKLKWYTILLLFAFWTYCSYSDIWISMNMRQYPGYGLCIAVAVAACVIIFLFSQSIQKLKVSFVFVFFGRNTLVVLAVQTITPYFFQATSTKQKILEMIVEIAIVVVYIFAKSLFLKTYHNIHNIFDHKNKE